MSSTQTTRQALPVGTWNVDPVHSHVGFAVEYTVGTFRGSFAPVDATLEVDGSGAARLAGTAPASGIKVQDDNLAGHLLSPDFFDAERAPELGFVSRSVEASGDRLVVAGDLTLKGVTRPVELRGTVTEPRTDAFGHERFGLTLGGTIDRTQFGLDWNMPLPSGEPALANDVELSAELYLVLAQES